MGIGPDTTPPRPTFDVTYSGSLSWSPSLLPFRSPSPAAPSCSPLRTPSPSPRLSPTVCPPQKIYPLPSSPPATTKVAVPAGVSRGMSRSKSKTGAQRASNQRRASKLLRILSSSRTGYLKHPARQRQRRRRRHRQRGVSLGRRLCSRSERCRSCSTPIHRHLATL